MPVDLARVTSSQRQTTEPVRPQPLPAVQDLAGQGFASALLKLQRSHGNRHVRRLLARNARDGAPPDVTPEVESSIAAARGGGQALASDVRQQMEGAFGVDFSAVRVHNDCQAHALNREVEATAFTTGKDIFFSSGAYDPASSSGRQLLAHELTHVVQQSGPSGGADRTALDRGGTGREEERKSGRSLQAKMEISHPESAEELEADDTAKRVAAMLAAAPLALAPVAPVSAAADAAHRSALARAPGHIARQEASVDTPEVAGTEKAAAEPPTIDDALRRHWIAVVLAEAAPDNQPQETNFAWLYYTRMMGAKHRGGDAETGLRGSSEFRLRKERYAVWLYKQGDTSLGQKPIGDAIANQNPTEFKFRGPEGNLTIYHSVEAVCKDAHGYYQLAQIENRLARVSALVDGILKEPGKTPIAGYEGQGNLQDFNNLSNDEPMWRLARYYFYLQKTEKGVKECVKFLPDRLGAQSQFVFNLRVIQAELGARGIGDIEKQAVPFVNVRNGEALFVWTREEITALPVKSQPKPKPQPAPAPEVPAPPQPLRPKRLPGAQGSGTLRRQAAEPLPAAQPASPPAPSWEDLKKSAQPLVLGKNLGEIEELIGGGKYAQYSTTVEQGVAAMLLPVFQDLARDDFASFQYDPVVGEDAATFGAFAQKAKDHMVRRLAEASAAIVLERARREIDSALAEETTARDKAASAQEAKKQRAELIAAAQKRIQEQLANDHPALKASIAEQARQRTAEELAKQSAGPLCYFISRYLYFRAISRVEADVSFANWYRAQLAHGHVGVTDSGGLAYGKAQGTPQEIAGLAEYKTLADIPEGVRLAISQQTYGTGVHFFLVFRDSQGVWRNLDHVYPNQRASEWHGNPTDQSLVKRLWCVPSMTAAARPGRVSTPGPTAPSAPSAPPSPPVDLTPEEQRLQQCFQSIPVPSMRTAGEQQSAPPSP